MSDEKKPFKFSTPEQLEQLGEKYIDGMIRMQDSGHKVDMTEPYVRAGYQIAAQLSGIREELQAMREPTLRWYRPDVLLPETHRDVIVVTRERMRDGGKKIVSTGWYDGEKWRGIGENLTVQQWTEKPL